MPQAKPRPFLASALLLVFLCPLAIAAGDPVKGREVFKSCSGCHNVDNDQRKMGPSLRTLFGKVTLRNGKHANEENVRALVLDGYNGMPAFRSFLNTEQVDDLMSYLITLNAKVATAGASAADSSFRTWCLNCHDPKRNGEKGPDLRGLFTKGKFSNGQPVTEPALRKLIDEGHGTAPALREWVDEPSRQAIIAYLKTY